MKSVSAHVVALVSSSLLASGCAVAEEGSVAEDVDATESELVTCSSEQYAQGLAHYKNAVAWSQDRLNVGVCRSEHGYLWGIADEASRAVMTCGAFRQTIQTSPWAEPLRRVLAPSLTLRSLTGELLVIRDSKFQNWTNTEALFARGVSFWARAEGAYGASVRIDFGGGGAATYGAHHFDTEGNVTWRTVPATYSLTKIDGEAGRRQVRVVHEGRVETFTLGVENAPEYKAAPIFTLQPSYGTFAPKLYSLVSECDA